jgi:mannose-6-phosphate isomerase-like protein (cupin superfamily)
MPNQTFYDLPAVSARRSQAGKLYQEFLRVPAMSAGVYVLAAGAADPQKPHKQDELYYVVHGQARMVVAEQERIVKAGTLIFVPAGVTHRFFDIVEELEVLVFFAPAESE